ncbi:MAG: hypothetical protein AseanaTS_27740 [Candidatus Pelagadaptatus aseana]|uniref:pilin n=1 Tax=Candidatus Pelagadaptatus aseana TaxID=3120508 RepID=UPI0039B2F7A8
MSKGKLLGLIILLLAVGLLADFYGKVQEQKRMQLAAQEQAAREKEQQAHEQRMQELQEQNRQREALLRREEEHMRLRQDMLEQSNKLQDRAVKSAKLAQGLQMATHFKMAISQFYQTHGYLPDSNLDIGLGQPLDYAEGAVAATDIRNDGIIAIGYTRETGIPGGEIYLLPQERDFGLSWRCESPDYKNINQLLTSCSYNRNRH